MTVERRAGQRAQVDPQGPLDVCLEAAHEEAIARGPLERRNPEDRRIADPCHPAPRAVGIDSSAEESGRGDGSQTDHALGGEAVEARAEVRLAVVDPRLELLLDGALGWVAPQRYVVGHRPVVASLLHDLDKLAAQLTGEGLARLVVFGRGGLAEEEHTAGRAVRLHAHGPHGLRQDTALLAVLVALLAGDGLDLEAIVFGVERESDHGALSMHWRICSRTHSGGRSLPSCFGGKCT